MTALRAETIGSRLAGVWENSVETLSTAPLPKDQPTLADTIAQFEKSRETRLAFFAQTYSVMNQLGAGVFHVVCACHTGALMSGASGGWMGGAGGLVGGHFHGDGSWHAEDDEKKLALTKSAPTARTTAPLIKRPTQPPTGHSDSSGIYDWLAPTNITTLQEVLTPPTSAVSASQILSI